MLRVVLTRLCGAILIVCLIAAKAAAAGETCPGDCDSDGNVSASELVLAVRSSLESLLCAAADADGDGSVSVHELVAVVVASLTRCGALPLATATSTFTPTSTPTETPTRTPTQTPTETSRPRVDGLWHEDGALPVSTDCDPLVEEVRLQLFPLDECDFRIAEDGDRATFHKDCRPDLDYEAHVDPNGVVEGVIVISEAQQGCRINLEARYSYAMGSSPTAGDYVLVWGFSSSCRPLRSCEQKLRTELARVEPIAPSFAPSRRRR